jgi:predicted MFS family arabinose efflux permease
MVLLASMAQNCAMGLAFGSFGPLLASTEQQFGISRAVAASGMSALMLALGLLSPLVGQALQRMTIRTVFMAGAALSATGYLGLALAPSFAIALVMYVVVGAGVCCSV